jgi:hypothetical protein
MAKAKLEVGTELGTFTRTTGRTYTHLVAVSGFRAELLEADRLGGIVAERKQAAKYRRIVATGRNPEDRLPVHQELTATWIADGSLLKWAEEAEARAAKLEARGPITVDGASGWLQDDAPVVPHVLGWCGRLDLARKLASSNEAARYRTVRIFEVATGMEVAK